VHGISNAMSTLNNAFQHLFDRLTSDMAPHDQVRLILNSHQLDLPISLPFLQRDRLTQERFLAAVERVVQSNDQFTLDCSVSVNVVHVEMLQGGTSRKRDVVNLESYLTKKRGIIQIKNKDDLCCVRAIVKAKAKLDKDPKYKSIVDHRRSTQTTHAQELHESASVPLGSCGFPEVKKFQATLPDYKLNVISKEHLNALIYSGPEAENIYIYTTATTITTSSQACLPSLRVNSEKFYIWYNDQVQRLYEFDFQAEILRYCQSDVDILRRCCLEFGELFHQVTDVDPFASCLL
jgi:hypothetical protein